MHQQQRKLHWAGREGESLAVVIPKLICEQANWEPSMEFFTNFAAGIARNEAGNIFIGPSYEALCGNSTLQAVRNALLCNELPRDTREQLAALLTELDKFRGPNWY